MSTPIFVDSILTFALVFGVLLALSLWVDAPGSSREEEERLRILLGSRDSSGLHEGSATGDHDRPFQFGRRPSWLNPHPFTYRQHLRLLLLRRHWQARRVTKSQVPTTVDT
jgi:hypothetical protein